MLATTLPSQDHILALDPTNLTVDLIEKHLLAAETSVVAVGAARGTPRTPFIEGCSPSPLAPSYASTAAIDILGTEDVEASSSLSGKRRSSKGKGGKSGGGGSVGGGGGGTVGVGVAMVAAVGVVAAAVVAVGVELSRGEVLAVARGSSSSVGARPLRLSSFTCGKLHTQHRCFSRLDDAWRAEFGDEAECPCWLELLRSGVDIFALSYDAILAAMYALFVSAEGDCYLCVPPDPGIEATALGASESALPGTASTEALHTFTLDSGASRCFFCDSTTLTPLPAPVPVILADPSGGPVLACSSAVLPCPAVPSGSLSCLHLPSFSTNLVSTAALQDAMVTTTTPGGQRVSICMCTRMGRHLAMFTRRNGSSPYTVTSEPPQVAAYAQVSASGPVAAPCSCRLLSHQTLLWHHRLGHPSPPCLRGMHSRLLVSGLPRSLPPLPPSPAPPCLPCVEGWQRAAPHSSSFPPTTAPLQTLHMDVKGEVPDVLIPWIRIVRLQLRERFRENLPILRLHSDRGGEFSSNLLWHFCRGEGILLSFTHLASSQQNRVADRHIGLVMEVARTSMIHAAAPHFFVAVCGPVRCASAQPLAPCLLAGDLAYTALDGEGWRCVGVPGLGLSFTTTPPVVSSPLRTSRLMTLFPFTISSPTAPPLSPPPPLFFASGPPPVDPLPPQGPAPSAVSQVDPLSGSVPVEVAGAESGGAETAELGGTELEGAEPGGTEFEGAESGGAEPRGVGSTSLGDGGVTAGAAGPGGARTRGTGAAGVGGVGSAGAGDPRARGAGARGTGAGDSGAGGTIARGAGAGGARAGDSGAGGTGVGGAGAGGAGAGDSGARGTSTGGAGAGGAGAGDPGVGGAGAGGTGAGGAGAGGNGLVDFAAACRLDYATNLVAESESNCPPSVGGECAFCTNVLEDSQEDFECLAAAGTSSRGHAACP
ncbi:unnamed protein product [Closterium sp. NIES-53]